MGIDGEVQCSFCALAHKSIEAARHQIMSQQRHQ
jgi:hypothetical protein